MSLTQVHTLLGLINTTQHVVCVVSTSCKFHNPSFYSEWGTVRVTYTLLLWKLSFILWFIDSSNVPSWFCVLFQEAPLSLLFNFSSQAERMFQVHNVHVLLMWSFHNRGLIVRNAPIVSSSPHPLTAFASLHPGSVWGASAGH